MPQEMEELCETEENEFKNEINPIKLADLGWCEDYKLIKIYCLQRHQYRDGFLQAENTVFGGFGAAIEDLDECFLWFTNARAARLSTLSPSKGGNPVKYQSFRSKGSLLYLEHQDQLQIVNSQFSQEESSDEEFLTEDSDDDDEAEKFKNALYKSSSKEAKMYLLSNHFQENNLLALKSDQRMSLIDEDFDLERAESLSTPLRIRSPSPNSCQMTGTVEKRPLVVEAIEEHSVEESLP